MKKNIIFKIIYIAAVVLVTLGLAYIALRETVPELIPLIRSGSAADIQAYLRASGTRKGILCTVLLQMVQVWSLFISGIPIQVAAGCVFGFCVAFVICHLSSSIAQILAIMVWRKLGRSLEKWMPVDVNGNRKLNEMLESKAPPSYLVVLACLLPVIPNGLIPLFASKMEISIPRFAISVWAGNIINVLLCCAAGNRVIQGDWIMACLFVLIPMALFLILWIFRDRILGFHSQSKA